MGGVLARDLVAIGNDPACLADGGFWAISTTYEGEFRAAKFATVCTEPFPPVSAAERISGKWESSTSQNQYLQYVEKIREEIANGGVYQVNACRRLSIKSSATLDLAFAKILQSNPAPFASYLRFDESEIASASPELFLTRDGNQIKTSPIKGTKRSANEKFGNKDRAENVMIVDLMRNDLGQICIPGSIAVPDLLRDEEHPGLSHLVSDVTGQLRAGISWSEILKALLPAGSISGAPKSAAKRIISELELTPRNTYCGVMGWVHGDQAVLSVAIRTFWREGEYIHFGTGAGITWSSDPQAEWDETQLKAERLISIVGGEL
ncbi:MAG: anthranilate synthase component I family protein [Actinobacteria bacterium]|nr:anthranilate synthase component I family protein [Actinomycetota bacterium]